MNLGIEFRRQAVAPTTKPSQMKTHWSQSSPLGQTAPSVFSSLQRMAPKERKTASHSTLVRISPVISLSLVHIVKVVNYLKSLLLCKWTEPETVQVSLSSQGSNSSVLVSWTSPPGNVEHFKVHLNSTSSGLQERELNSTSTSSLFDGLSAGTFYTASVFTFSGPFNASSGFITNATCEYDTFVGFESFCWCHIQ